MDFNRCLSKEPHQAITLDTWQKTANLMAQLYDSTCGAIVQFRDDEFNVVVTSESEGNFLTRDSTWPLELKTFCRHIIETKRKLYAPSPKQDMYWCNSPAVAEGPVRSYYGVPIFWPDQSVFGTICIIDTKETDYPPALLQLLEQFALLIEADLQHIIDYEQIKELALTDELTGIYNRRGLSIIASQSLDLARELAHNIAVIYFDIDDFKSINDLYGHAVGDQVIKSFGAILKRYCRKSDVVSRVGGDEFTIVLQKANEADIDLICQRIEQAFNREITSIDSKKQTKARISYGYKIYSTTSELSLDDMISRADDVMYQYKRARKLKSNC